MEKMSGESMNLLNENIEKLKALFPEIVTDGKIDFDMLKTLLGEEVDASNEKYSFNWVGKRNCIKFAQTPSTGTLIPCKEKSVDFDSTQNIYIEGDNVEALKLLQKTYFGKIKMIYIDPPYNTGNDFVYHDDYKDSIENYKKITGQQATANPETNGRFHTDWLNMMYPRLKLAKDLLSDDGVIFISIDDNEQANLKKICDEVFGETNFVASFPWRKRTAKSDVTYGVSQDYEQILAYARSDMFTASVVGKERKYYESDDFPGKPWRIHDLTKQTTASERPNSFFTIVNPKNGKEYPANPNATWRITIDTFDEYYKNGRIVFPGDYSFLNITKPVLRYWKEDDILKAGESFGRVAVSTNLPDEIGMSQDGTKEIYDLFVSKVFSFPKPLSLLKYLIQTTNDNTALVLDFFSGSATTAHAVMQLNAEDGGNRKFIMVQLPELCDEKSEAYKAGYKTICDIGEERIRRAGAKIKEENPLTTLNLDTGFKVFRLDSTNIVPWNNAEKLDEMRLYDYAKTIKDGRDDLSVAYEIMLKYGVFDKPMKETVVSGKKMYDVGEGYMIICLADGVTMTDVEAIARLNPHCVVFKESGFADDNEKINATHTLERGGVEKILCI